MTSQAPPAPTAADVQPCWRSGGSFRRPMLVAEGAEGTHQVEARWELGGCKAEFRSVGDFSLAAGDRDVASAGPGARFSLEEEAGGRRRTLELRGGAGGRLQREYRVDGAARPWDAEAQGWLAAALPDLVAHVGFAAAGRMRAALAAGGVDAALREVRAIPESAVRVIYYGALLDQPGLGAADVRRVMDAAGESRESDDTRATVLLRVLRRPGASAADVLERAAGLSDDWLAQVLAGVAQRFPLEGATREAFFRRVEGMRSDWREQVLVGVVRAPNVSDAVLGDALLAARGIGSEDTRAAFLVEVARRHRPTGALRERYLQAAASIRSREQRDQAMAALGG